MDKDERARNRVALFRSLFRGREDVFAQRWERSDGRSGYSLAAIKDWKAINKSRLEDRKKVDQKTRKFLPPASTIRFMPTSRAVSTEYRYAVEQAVRYRRPVAVMIDEAQHLGKIPSGRRLLDQLDVIKSIANQTKTAHVLFGTYDLLAFRNLNGQLARRSLPGPIWKPKPCRSPNGSRCTRRLPRGNSSSMRLARR